MDKKERIEIELKTSVIDKNKATTDLLTIIKWLLILWIATGVLGSIFTLSYLIGFISKY